MRIKVSDYLAELLVKHSITHLFTVTGGGAMHLNDGFGHNKNLESIYCHHEQSCAIAAESYARINNQMAAVCVTTGPGGTNALTGVVGGWLDSIPMLIISGQVRYDTTVRSTGLHLRAMGDQEFDICKSVQSMTKYCEMITDPNRIEYCLEKAIYLAMTGRPGPCWLDIPVNIQGSYIETDDLVKFEKPEDTSQETIDETIFDTVIEKIKNAKRPVLYPGNGVRISGSHEMFVRVANMLNIPIVETWNGIDIIPNNHKLFAGRGGIMGDRAGNFAVQNSDLILAIGNRLSIRQVGYNHASWAREAEVIMVDVDAEELKKPIIHVELPICMDAAVFLGELEKRLIKQNIAELSTQSDWIHQCHLWTEKYPVVTKEHYKKQEQTNVYCFMGELSKKVSEDKMIVVGNGSACVVGSHGYIIKKGQRFIINSAIASMGYDLPAAIGVCFANARKEVICITGDGSIQMNLQELQTIKHHQLPIKIFVISNEGYHSIRQTQKNYFGEPLVGVGADSKDLSFPSMQKLADAYEIQYFSCHTNDELEIIDTVLAKNHPVICEIFVSSEQSFEPKAAAKRLPDGTMVSAALEDLAPFLPKEELMENMYIPLMEDAF